MSPRTTFRQSTIKDSLHRLHKKTYKAYARKHRGDEASCQGVLDGTENVQSTKLQATCVNSCRFRTAGYDTSAVVDPPILDEVDDSSEDQPDEPEICARTQVEETPRWRMTSVLQHHVLLLESLVCAKASETCRGGAAAETGRTISSDVAAFNNKLKRPFTNWMLRLHPFLDKVFSWEAAQGQGRLTFATASLKETQTTRTTTTKPPTRSTQRKHCQRRARSKNMTTRRTTPSS